MKPITFQLGNDYYNSKGEDGAEAFIEMYLTDNSIELSSHEFNDYDSASSVILLSYGMFEKIIDKYESFKKIRDGLTQSSEQKVRE